MKISIFLFAITLMLGINSVFAQKQQELRIKQNAVSKIPAAKVKVKFLEVVEDSRCPKDVDCVWAGNAKVKFELSRKGKETKIVELNTGLGDRSAVYEGYEITIMDLLPHRSSQPSAVASNYEAVLTFAKK